MYLHTIIIGKEARKPLHYVKSVQAVAGRGLEGDRYFYGKGTFNKPQLSQGVREVSILPYDSLSQCNERVDAKLEFLDLRRNLVIGNFDYEAVKEREFNIGSATFKIVRTCPPCRYLSRLLGQDMMDGLKYIGGYRATIIRSGRLTVGDNLVVL